MNVSTFLRNLVWLAVISGAVYGVLRATCIRLWTFPADDKLLVASVTPSLEAGDLLVLWRLGTPGFGDVVRCPDPEASGRYVVARLLGEAHDKLQFENSVVSVNGKRITADHACSPAKVSVAHPRTGTPVELSCELEQVSRGEFPRLRGPNSEGAPVTRVEVAPGRVYLVSDNRYFHDDSRDFGALPAASCNERVLLRLWSARGWFDADRRFTAIR